MQLNGSHILRLKNIIYNLFKIMQWVFSGRMAGWLALLRFELGSSKGHESSTMTTRASLHTRAPHDCIRRLIVGDLWIIICRHYIKPVLHFSPRLVTVIVSVLQLLTLRLFRKTISRSFKRDIITSGQPSLILPSMSPFCMQQSLKPSRFFHLAARCWRSTESVAR